MKNSFGGKRDTKKIQLMVLVRPLACRYFKKRTFILHSSCSAKLCYSRYSCWTGMFSSHPSLSCFSKLLPPMGKLQLQKMQFQPKKRPGVQEESPGSPLSLCSELRARSIQNWGSRNKPDPGKKNFPEFPF